MHGLGAGVDKDPDLPRSARSCGRAHGPGAGRWHDSQVSDPIRTESLWVRMHDWIAVEAELPDPMPGSVLEGTGLRVRGALAPTEPGTVEGLVRCERVVGDSQTVEYLVTGSAVSARDFDTDSGHGGADVVLEVNGFPIQAQTDGWSRDVVHGSRLSVRGELHVIPYYEWTAFDLVDTRGTWAVEEARRLRGGDMLLRLRLVSA